MSTAKLWLNLFETIWEIVLLNKGNIEPQRKSVA